MLIVNILKFKFLKIKFMNRHDLWVNIDNYKRTMFLKGELKKIILKSIKKSKNISYMRRYQASYYLVNLPRISSNVALVNRCVVSGRVWSVNRKTKYSRFFFRTEAGNSNIPGCRRASW